MDRVYEFSGKELMEFAESSNAFVGSEKIIEKFNANPDDTDFRVYLLQYIDDIPLAGFHWDYFSGEPTYTTVSAEEALHIFANDYNKKLELITTTITDKSFRYVVTRDKVFMSEVNSP